jgi:hypothetical protein
MNLEESRFVATILHIPVYSATCEKGTGMCTVKEKVLSKIYLVKIRFHLFRLALVKRVSFRFARVFR